MEENETEMKVETQQDILAHRGSLSVRSELLLFYVPEYNLWMDEP